jgi:hypothetical protein
MKELLAILQAMERARGTLASYAQPGHRQPEATLVELMQILGNDEVTCALEKVQTNLGAPPIAPDTPSLAVSKAS